MFLNHLWTFLFYLWIASEVVLALATRTTRSRGNRQDRGSLLLLWVVIGSSIAASYWSVAFAPAATLHHMPWIGPLALTLILAGLVIRWIAIVSLGRAFSVNVAIRPDQKIYRRGMYRYIRHPSYLGLMLIFVAIGVSTRNLVGLAIIVVATTVALLYRIRVEEQALHHAFGPTYADYARNTRRLIPGIY